MKIKIKEYEYLIKDGKVTRTEIPQHWFHNLWAGIILFFFKLINYKHVHNVDQRGKKVIDEILDIRGLRTCAHTDSGGQVYVSQFMIKIGKYYF